MKTTFPIRHQSASSELFVEKYLPLKQDSASSHHAIYDSSLVMKNLENLLKKTTSEVDKLKKQKQRKHTDCKDLAKR